MSSAAYIAPNTSSDPVGDSLYRKIAWRIMPILVIGYIIAYIDRVNVSFAKLQMLGDLKFSDSVYGVGAGIFFLGYFAFEIPSNIILHKVGARVWICRVIVTWGVISALTALASVLLSNGAPIASVSKRLGHADPYVTMKIYTHVQPADDAAAAALWGKVTSGIIARTRKPIAKPGFGPVLVTECDKKRA